jgi:hypothetical protein
MEEAFTNYLLTSVGLGILVGPRITWGVRPQASALPAIVLHKIDGSPQYADEGEVGLFTARIQIDNWGVTYASAKNVSREAMARLSGGGAAFTYDNFDFDISFNESGQDTFELGDGGEHLYRVRLDFTIWYKEN